MTGYPEMIHIVQLLMCLMMKKYTNISSLLSELKQNKQSQVWFIVICKNSELYCNRIILNRMVESSVKCNL